MHSLRSVLVLKVEQRMALVDELETQFASSCATATNLVAKLTPP